MSKKKKESRKTISCGAVTWRLVEGKLELLLIKQFEHSDSWGIPKGHINSGESLEECAIRETREETGVTVKLHARLPDCTTNYKNTTKRVVSYIATPIGSHEPIHDDPDNEVADARWISVDELPKVHIYQGQLIAGAIELIRGQLNEPKDH